MKVSIINIFRNHKNRITMLFYVCVLLFCLGCKKHNNMITAYKSNFDNKEINIDSELDLLTNNYEEWKMVDNRIECLVSDEQRIINLESRKLASYEGNIEMTVRLGFFNATISNLNKNWAGFHIGATTNYKKGLNIGVCTDGTLFIDTPSPNYKNKTIIKVLKKGIDLKVLITKNNESHTIDFAAIDFISGKILSRISKKNISSAQLTGGFALISNFEKSKLEKVNQTKSVWFKNWKIKGSKVSVSSKK